MERFDERLVVNEDSGNKFYQVIPCEDGKFVLYADSQATIAALQARVQECEAAMEKQVAILEEINKLDAERAAFVVDLKAQLTQRTAELEAVNKHQQLHDRIFVRQRDLMAHYVATIREAIRRLGNSTHSKEQPEPYESRTPVIAAFLGQALGVTAEEAERERADLQAELERVSALVKALPKVEVITSDTVVNIVQQYNFHRWMLRALQHRQGMEG